MGGRGEGGGCGGAAGGVGGGERGVGNGPADPDGGGVLEGVEVEPRMFGGKSLYAAEEEWSPRMICEGHRGEGGIEARDWLGEGALG